MPRRWRAGPLQGRRLPVPLASEKASSCRGVCAKEPSRLPGRRWRLMAPAPPRFCHRRTYPEQQVVQLLAAAVRALHGAVHRVELEAEGGGGLVRVAAVQRQPEGRAVLAAVALLRHQPPEAGLLVAQQQRACRGAAAVRHQLHACEGVGGKGGRAGSRWRWGLGDGGASRASHHLPRCRPATPRPGARCWRSERAPSWFALESLLGARRRRRRRRRCMMSTRLACTLSQPKTDGFVRKERRRPQA